MRGIKALGVLLLSGLVMAPVAQAQSWKSEATRYFEADEYEQCIKAAKPHKDELNGLMFLSFCHLQEHIFNQTQSDKEYFKSYMMTLKDKVGIDDIENIYYFVRQNDKPKVVAEARGLAKEAFENVVDIEEALRLIPFLKTEDKDTRRLTLRTIERVIKPKRKYLKDGGTLRAKDKAVFENEGLIKGLLENVEDSTARNTLEMIEEPVLKHLAKHPGKYTEKLDKSIKRDIERRKKKYPESSWYSMVGKKL